MGERVPEYLINNKRRKVVQVVPVALATPPAAATSCRNFCNTFCLPGQVDFKIMS